jgi:hypothetical protein
MTTDPEAHEPTERQLALFRAVEDVHDMTAATVVLVVDADGEIVAASGDVDLVPAPMRTILSGKRLATAGSVRALLASVGEIDTRLNVTAFDVGSAHVMAILFDADADITTVAAVGEEARALIGEILSAPAA